MDRRMFMKKGLLAVLGTGLASPAVLFPNNLAHAAAQEGAKAMKILVLTGSPRKNGNSNMLADNFIKGATDKGHEIVRFDAAEKMFILVLPAIPAVWTDPASLMMILILCGNILSKRIWLLLQRLCIILAFHPSSRLLLTDFMRLTGKSTSIKKLFCS